MKIPVMFEVGQPERQAIAAYYGVENCRRQVMASREMCGRFLEQQGRFALGLVVKCTTTPREKMKTLVAPGSGKARRN